MDEGSHVWPQFRLAYDEFLRRKKRLEIHQGRGYAPGEPILFVLLTRSDNLKKDPKSRNWFLTRGAHVQMIVEGDEMVVLKMELALEGES